MIVKTTETRNSKRQAEQRRQPSMVLCKRSDHSSFERCTPWCDPVTGPKSDTILKSNEYGDSIQIDCSKPEIVLEVKSVLCEH